MIFKWMNESEISIEGDFILKVKVSHDFKETYDSASVMVMADVSHQAKCCYEHLSIEPKTVKNIRSGK